MQQIKIIHSFDEKEVERQTNLFTEILERRGYLVKSMTQTVSFNDKAGQLFFSSVIVYDRPLYTEPPLI